MRILVIHTHYQIKGGEDTVFAQETALLKPDFDIQELQFYNQPGIKGAIQFLASIFNLQSRSRIAKAIDQFRPDLIQVHNWHYAVGPVVFRLAARKRIPVVLTVPNFRLLCPSATLLHNGKLYTESVRAAFPWDAVRKGVYRNSVVQTFWLAFIIWLHRKAGTWNSITRYIVLTAQARDLYLDSNLGISAAQLVVKQNFVNDPGSASVQRKPRFLFIGRLSEEKGVLLLLDVFRNNGQQLVLGGEGPLAEKVKEAAAAYPNIHYLGMLSREGVLEQLRSNEVLLFPSLWYEGMPMTIIESLATGTPVIASDLGAMASMITDGVNGLKFEAGNAAAFNEKIQYWASLDQQAKSRFYEQSRQDYLEKYTPELNKKLLSDIYHKAAADYTQKQRTN